MKHKFSSVSTAIVILCLALPSSLIFNLKIFLKMKGLKTCHLSTFNRVSIRRFFVAFQMLKYFSQQTCLQFALLILTYFDPIQIQTKELKDRLMIYFALERFLADIKLTETYFYVPLLRCCLHCIYSDILAY